MIQTVKSHSAGFALSLVIGALAFLLNSWIGAPASLAALIIGIAGAHLYDYPTLKTGIDWSSKFILRFGVALLGFRIAAEDLLILGWQGCVAVAGAIALTIVSGKLLAKLIGLRPDFGLLSGSSVAICGASAAMAVASVLPDHKRKDQDLSLTILIVTAFSTSVMVLYPYLGQAVGLEGSSLAIFLGGAIHDVAQTAGAGYAVSDEVGDLAILTKMIRVAFLLPVTLLLILSLKPKDQAEDAAGFSKIPLPFFLFAFIGFAVLNSFMVMPEIFTNAASWVSKVALVTAIAAVGLKTKIKELFSVGYKPILLIALETFIMAALIFAYVRHGMPMFA